MRILCTLLAILLLPTTFALAQQPSTDPLPTPPQTNLPKDAPLNPALPTVFIVGDSTARNGANLGWGDHFAQFFDTTRINVANRAVAGRSSRTYITEGHWARVLAEMKPGDFLLLQMGHNDGGDLDGAKPRGSLKGIGSETRDLPQTAGPFAGKTETVRTYGGYMRQMIDEAKAKGVHVTLLTLTVRNIWKDGHIERDMGYTTYIRALAGQEHIPLADLSTAEANLLDQKGAAATAALFPKDHTHTSADGADLVAHAVITALQQIHSPLLTFALIPAP